MNTKSGMIFYEKVKAMYGLTELYEKKRQSLVWFLSERMKSGLGFVVRRKRLGLVLLW
jgi:hypothetical protein